MKLMIYSRSKPVLADYKIGNEQYPCNPLFMAPATSVESRCEKMFFYFTRNVKMKIVICKY